ncbi:MULTISPECIES: TetR/AcrR family transcriptional regulator [Gracilibacillus]|uniref:TetR/AcrR family transcriptional regulator n=1 Tax=Gracilibacillus TaxID=74385 RepID=UPI000825EB55|nr:MULTISPECIES: TetR/AcrR family transcriptional regulator [Gracilibacillus]
MKTKDVILKVSVELFSLYGYEGTTLAMIAKEVGIKKPSLYAHFNSKEALFLAVLDQMSAEYETFIQAAIEKEKDSGASSQLYAILQAYILELPKDEAGMNFYNRFYIYPPTGLEENVKRYVIEGDQVVKSGIHTIIETGKQQQQIRKDYTTSQMTHTFFYLLEGLYNETMLYAEEDITCHMEQVWEMFWNNIMHPVTDS